MSIRRMGAGLVMLGCCILALSAGDFACAAEADTPVEARLDIISTPTLGGGGQALWAGFFNASAGVASSGTAAPAAAALTFTLRQPGGAPPRTVSMTLAPEAGALTERIYAFETPQAGTYEVGARLTLTAAGGKTWTKEETRSFSVAPAAAQGATTGLSQKTTLATTPIVTPLTVNGPLLADEIKTPGEWKWYSLSLPWGQRLSIEGIHGTLVNHEISFQSGNSGWSPQAYGVCPDGSFSSKISFQVSSPSGTRYVVVRSLDEKSTGTFYLHVTTGPWLSSYSINNGDISTGNQIVRLNNDFYAFPSTVNQYMASESSDFKNAQWQAYSQMPLFTLSNGNGKKTIYFKVRNNLGAESVIVTDDILLTTPQELVPNIAAFSGNVTVKGGTAWYQFMVPFHGRYRIETTTLSNGPAYASIWGPNSDNTLIVRDRATGMNMPRIIRNDLDVGTYYVKVDANNVPCNFSIKLILEGMISSFTINNGAAETASRMVTLNNTFVGTPAYCMASIYPDFRGAAWLPYSANPTFKLNGGNITKRVYFKVKNAAGAESEARSDTIVLKEFVALPADGAWRAGNINPAGEADFYQFMVAAEGNYTLETRCGTLEDTVLVLYGPSSKSLVAAQDDDSGENYAAKISARLKRGTYYAKVGSHFADDGGTYSIMLKRD